MNDNKATIILEKILADLNRYYAKNKIDLSLDILESGGMYNIYMESHNNVDVYETHYEPLIRINNRKVGLMIEEDIYKTIDIPEFINFCKETLNKYEKEVNIIYREFLTHI